MSLLTFKNVSHTRLITSVFILLVVMPLCIYVMFAKYSGKFPKYYPEIYYTIYAADFYYADRRARLQALPRDALKTIDMLRNETRNNQLVGLTSVLKPIKLGTDKLSKTPMELYNDGSGDCSDFAYLWYVQLKALGIPAKILYLSMIDPFDESATEFLHVVTLTVDADGHDVVLDISEASFGKIISYDAWVEKFKVKLLYEIDETGFHLTK